MPLSAGHAATMPLRPPRMQGCQRPDRACQPAHHVPGTRWRPACLSAFPWARHAPCALATCPGATHPPAVFYALWTPFMFLMGYSDPRRPASDHLYGEGRDGWTRAAAGRWAGSRVQGEQLAAAVHAAASAAAAAHVRCRSPSWPRPLRHCRVALPFLAGPLHLDLRHDLRLLAPQVLHGSPACRCWLLHASPAACVGDCPAAAAVLRAWVRQQPQPHMRTCRGMRCVHQYVYVPPET